MTENKRKEMLKDIRDGYIDAWDNIAIDELFEQIEKEHIEIQQYRAIGTSEEFKALKEKSVAKKPAPIDYEKYIDVVENAKFLRGAYWCPNCKHTVRSGAYCDDCGQKLDWQ